MPRYAAIDIGSNTFRLLIADKKESSGRQTQYPPIRWSVVHYHHHIVRLGEGLDLHRRLSEAGMQRGIAALRDFALRLERHRVEKEHTIAIATAAMREAENADDFRRRVQRETGIDIAIISGEEEAAMSLAGACAVLRPETRADMLLFDIGGGSTEFIRAQHGVIIDGISRKLGVVRLVEAHLHSDPPSTADYQAMKRAALAHLEAVTRSWGDGTAPKHLVGTAGTVTTLAATELDLYPYDANVINNHLITRESFNALKGKLLAMTHSQREALRTIEEGRGDLIVAGIAIIEAVMDYWDYDAMTTVDAGLLEGAWLRISQSK